MEKEISKPVVKLCTLWMLDQEYETRDKRISQHHISNGIWETRGAEIRNGVRIYYLDCIYPHREDLIKGTRVKMEEAMLIELCHQVKIVKCPKYKSMIDKKQSK